MKFRLFGLVLLFSVLICAPTMASEPGRVCPEVLKGWIFAKNQVAVIDIQSPSDFEAHNYERSVHVPDAATLLKLARSYADGAEPLVVVSESGGEDAEKGAARLVSGGVRAERIFILEGGMAAALQSASCDCCKVEAKAK